MTDHAAAPPRKKRSAGRDLPAAIAVGVGLVALLVLTLAFWHWGFILLAALMLSLGAIEVHQAMKRLGMNAAIIPIVLGTVGMIVGTYAAATVPDALLWRMPWHSVLLMFLGATVLAALIVRFPKGHENFVRDASASVFIIGYIALLGSFTALILAGENGAARMVTFLLCVVANDTGGYAVGVLLGRTPLAPAISPKKTWEGLAGSLGFAIVAGSVLAHFVLDVGWWVGAFVGIVCVFFGTAGDLIESSIKRDVGIKDMSSILPGHGGVMDRLDSMLVAAAPAWLVMYLFVPGG
ncbi:phosphatidate cytidylyltransferase [Propioniciclava sinopodophylli]|uniref:Phosphatidate cytidylyltransferase n=1 Tax=Propioniciclava sinopodophylli TaxID=1837344 RepID=A0A4Q9KDT1_9ACTN|nr:phosphatidate cytidylyltransferase [Propioniciclava sinopodophylli]TBT84283.1 phosphatidate cytidylyltransferase [Propioniciclava sinopodophylli]